MPNYDPFAGYSDDQQDWDESSFYDNDPNSFTIWKPEDPDFNYSPTMQERREYNISRERLSRRLEPGLSGFAEIRGESGFGADYKKASIGWTGWGSKASVGLGVWGHDQGLDDPFPIVGGAIITPTIDIYTREREQQFDQHGRALDEREYRTSSGIIHGRAEVANIFRRAGETGLKTYNRFIEQGMEIDQARMQADRAARASVRSQTASFPREDFGQRWGWTYGLREAMKGAANIRLHGEYGVGPHELFKQLGQYGGGYFTRSTSPSEDIEHPERGAWEAYSLDSLYALGWFKGEDGGFITGTNKPDKRRQLGVQRLASPIGADNLMRRGRLSNDRMLNTTAVFMENYAYSEGSGVADPGLVSGFTDFRPHIIEKPMMADDSWKVRFSGGRDMTGLRKYLPFGKRAGDFGTAGESLPIGEQYLNGEWQPLNEEPGRDGVRQRLFGYRKTSEGYQALVESISPYESGTAKLMHHGMKALLFQSGSIIKRMQSNVRSAQALGELPMDVEAPRMVLPMPKDWLQTYRGMFDFLPEETLRGMGIDQKTIDSRDWQKVGPGVVDRLSQYVNKRKFSFEQVYEVPVERLGAFENAGNIVNGVEYLQKGGVDFARFTARHTGYAIPVAAGIRMEYPGRSPMNSPEELMQLRRMYPKLAEQLAGRSNPASRIWGTAVAAAEGATPEGVVNHEDLPWLSARFNEEGEYDAEGGMHNLIKNLAREMRAKDQMGPVMGPGGVLMPNPNDMLSQSTMNYSGQEQGQFMSSYLNVMKLLGKGEDATDAAVAFAKNLQVFASGHNVRRQALGAKLDRAVEGTFTSHLAIPDNTVVAGSGALMKLAGIESDDPDAADKLTALVRYLEQGGNSLHALGTRRPISDMFNQLGTPTKIITERMARDLYGVEIENLGRSFAVSPTLAAVWRGDVDADRALLQGVSNVDYGMRDGAMDVQIHTSSEILDAMYGETMLSRQVKALQTRAPDAYSKWENSQDAETRRYVRQGLKADDRSLEATRALSKALHGIDVDWNESKKWSDSLMTEEGALARGPKALKDITKNQPHGYAYYADPANGTSFTRQQMLDKFEQTSKSKMLMGRGYNRYLRGLTSLARDENELQAAVTMASTLYQKALDNQPMTSGELMLFNMMESMGPSGAMYDKFGKEQGYVGGGGKFTGGPAGMVGLLARSIVDMDVPREALGTLFSRDEAVSLAVQAGGSAWSIQKAIGAGGREMENSRAFLEDPERAGILPQLIQSLHYSKESIAPANEAQKTYAAQGQRIRNMVAVTSRSSKMKTTDDFGNEVEVKGMWAGDATAAMRNMAGLDSMSWWRRKMANRMGLSPLFFASNEEVDAAMPSFANPSLPGEEFKAFISEKEANVLEGLRQMPAGQAQHIAAMISQPARYTPKGGSPSFDTGPSGWDKFNSSQRDELRKMARNNAPEDVILARMRAFLDQMEVPDTVSGQQPLEPGPIGGPFAPDDADPFEGAPLPYEVDDGGGQTRTLGDGTTAEARIPKSKRTAVRFNPAKASPLRQQLIEAADALKRGESVDLTKNPPVINLLQSMMGSQGRKISAYFQQYSNGSYQLRASLDDMGLEGHGKDLLEQIVTKGMTEGYTPEVLGLMEEGYQHSGLGQGMMRAARDVIDADLGSMDTKGLWRTKDSAEKIVSALGYRRGSKENGPLSDEGPLGKKLDELSKNLTELTDVQKKHLDLARERVQADPGYQSAMRFADQVEAAAKTGTPMKLSDENVARLKTVNALNKRYGLPNEKIDDILESNDTSGILEALGKSDKTPGRLGTAINKMLKRPEGAPTMGNADIGNMFTELTLGWTAFRMRMAWNLTTGAQKDWQNAFMNEEGAAVGAALAGGAQTGTLGDSSRYLSANAAMTNAKAQLGQGVAQVYAPFMSGVAGFNTGPGVGAAATIGGTALGTSFLAAMGANMIGGVEGLAAVGAAAGPIGLAAGGLAAGLLGGSYLIGEAPAWVKYDNDTWAQDWRKGSQLAASSVKNAGGPKIGQWGAQVLSAPLNAMLNAAEGLTRNISPNLDIEGVRSKVDAFLYGSSTVAAIEKEKAGYAPGTLARDADELRKWTANKFKNTVNVDQMLQIEGTLFPITGTTAQDLYQGNAPQVEKLTEHFAAYLQAGANPNTLFSSQLTAAQAAGVPVGAATTNFLVQFGDHMNSIGGQNRTGYEEAYKNLASIPQALGRATTQDEADRMFALTERYGNEQRARNEVAGIAGVGWFTSAFGIMSGGGQAQILGREFGTMDVPTTDVAQQIAAMTAPSFERGGVQTNAAAQMIKKFAETQPENALGVSNLIIQAESVSLQTGMSMTDLVNKANDAGYSTRSLADQRWFLSTQAGISGLAPSSMLPGSAQAQAFEQSYEGLSIPQQTAYKAASSMLSQVMPMGYTQQQLSGFGQMLLGGMSIPELGLGLQAMTGRAGLATSMGIPAASPMAQMLEASTIGLPGNLKMTQDQVRGLSGMLSPSAFQYMTGKQIAGMGRGLSGMFMDVWAGDMSLHQFGRGVEAATGSTPWGMSAQLGFGPGSLTDELGRQYGMYEPWTATAGRQAGQSFAPLFDLQMNAAYAGLAAQSAALPIEHRTFERQQAAKRFEWGSGPFTSLSQVQSAIYPEVGSGVEPIQVGQGMQISDSTIGMAQQEAAIRKQMWQENIAYQQQSIGFARQGLEIAKQELELSKQQYGAQREYNLSEREANRGMQVRQQQWSAEDFAIKTERMGISQQWAMEDLQRARRFASGRERVDIERNIQRTMLTQGWEQDDSKRGRSREQEVQRFQDARYNAAVAFEQKLNELQMQRFALQEQKLALQEAQLAAQEAHLNNQAVLQGQLQKLEEERFQFQYDQTQAQMKDDETLEKLRQEVRRAEIAYQTAQLANAETLRKSQEEWMKKLEEGETTGILDKWIEFFNKIQGGPPTTVVPPVEPPPVDDGNRNAQRTNIATTSTRQPEMGIGRELSGGSQPTIVNFVLDGEVIMQAVIKPERLRPVVEEINHRSRLR